MLEIVAGADPREEQGYAVARFSAYRQTTEPLQIIPLREKALRYQGLYKRPHEERDWAAVVPNLSGTDEHEFRLLQISCSHGLVRLATGLCSVDFCDMLLLADPAELFDARRRALRRHGRQAPVRAEYRDKDGWPSADRVPAQAMEQRDPLERRTSCERSA